jgi:hypothetical protein
MGSAAHFYVVGDVHGHLNKVLRALRVARLIDRHNHWNGGAAHLWFMGDFCDRGPDGVPAIDYVMGLQQQAATAGGQVSALIGNHDALIVALMRFRNGPDASTADLFNLVWRRNGGQSADLARLKPQHTEWLANLPALARVGGYLLAHADTPLYLEYGRTIDEVNTAFRQLVQSADLQAWDRLLEQFAEHAGFSERRADGARRAARVLETFGGRRIVHGHTPICIVRDVDAASVQGPLEYANGLCLNVDGGMYMGGPGFVVQLPL